eukprot:TRINITY_DN15661_c0_g1_i1.p1 TRINITY_DN15661_c0_g1~~TRINITY_DN15661_c0_g1_i1.p1  ORF type:complete len:316 (+),score=34.48 TRINITY_DN15661_c0_g1_i1:67-1014(+)
MRVNEDEEMINIQCRIHPSRLSLPDNLFKKAYTGFAAVSRPLGPNDEFVRITSITSIDSICKLLNNTKVVPPSTQTPDEDCIWIQLDSAGCAGLLGQKGAPPTSPVTVSVINSHDTVSASKLYIRLLKPNPITKKADTNPQRLFTEDDIRFLKGSKIRTRALGPMEVVAVTPEIRGAVYKVTAETDIQLTRTPIPDADVSKKSEVLDQNLPIAGVSGSSHVAKVPKLLFRKYPVFKKVAIFILYYSQQLGCSAESLLWWNTQVPCLVNQDTKRMYDEWENTPVAPVPPSLKPMIDQLSGYEVNDQMLGAFTFDGD